MRWPVIPSTSISGLQVWVTCCRCCQDTGCRSEDAGTDCCGGEASSQEEVQKEQGEAQLTCISNLNILMIVVFVCILHRLFCSLMGPELALTTVQSLIDLFNSALSGGFVLLAPVTMTTLTITRPLTLMQR